MWEGTDKSKKKIEECKQSLDTLTSKFKNLQKENKLLQDSIWIFRDSIHRIDIKRSKRKDNDSNR